MSMRMVRLRRLHTVRMPLLDTRKDMAMDIRDDIW
jgi:hypothetical protein